MLLIEVP